MILRILHTMMKVNVAWQYSKDNIENYPYYKISYLRSYLPKFIDCQRCWMDLVAG